MSLREELRRRLWPADTFVDFDTGLNSAVKKLRDVLSVLRDLNVELKSVNAVKSADPILDGPGTTT